MKQFIITEEERKRILSMHESKKNINSILFEDTEKVEPLKTPLKVRGKGVKDNSKEIFVTLTEKKTYSNYCYFNGTTMDSKPVNAIVYCSESNKGENMIYFQGEDYSPTQIGIREMSKACGCDQYVQQGGSDSDVV